MTPDQNTAISALARLDGGHGTPPTLRVYHNPYASVELRPDLFDGLPVVQPWLPGASTVPDCV